MSYVRVPVKVKAKKGNKKPKKAAADIAADKNLSSELNEPRWSVVTFEICAASGLTYDEAAEEAKKLEAKKISGLCIVTDEAAGKVKSKK